MKRTVQFRGKNENGEWVYGSLVELHNQCSITVPTISIIYGKPTQDYYEYNVDTDTVGQFTGLYDYLKHPIFEGDILCVNSTKYGRGYVKWHDKLAQFVVQMIDSNQWYPIADGVVEICGNIHDNAELLKTE